jgi:hypothetical protein
MEYRRRRTSLELARLRDQVIREWVECSVSNISVYFQAASIRYFGMDIAPKNPMHYEIDEEKVMGLLPTVRFMYRETQDHFQKLGLKEITLFRGIRQENALFGPLQSYTTDYEVAVKYDDYTVIEDTIPVHHILMYHEGPGWVNGSNGNESEYIVLYEVKL